MKRVLGFRKLTTLLNSRIAMSTQISAPPECLLKPINVPNKLLLGPGPANAPPRVLAAGALPLLGHLHPEFTQIMDEIKDGLKYAFQTENEMTLAISGTGHAGMEAAVCNLVEQDDVVVVLSNGLWGERFADMAERHGGDVRKIEKPLGEIFTLQDVQEALDKHKPSLLFAAHSESSATVLQPLEGIGDLCHSHDCVFVVDCVASLGAVPIYMDKWGIDVLYSGSQKVLSAPPGTAPISFSPKACAKLKARKTKVRSFYFDMNMLANYWGIDKDARRYHHTGPVSSMYALREALARLAEEGLEASWDRHRLVSEMLYEGLETLGLKPFVSNRNWRLPTVTGIIVPDGVSWKQVAQYIMTKYKIEISGGLGASAGKIWRVGFMGYNAIPDNVNMLLRVLKEAIKEAKENPQSVL